jgi:hypothetical protein
MFNSNLMGNEHTRETFNISRESLYAYMYHNNKCIILQYARECIIATGKRQLKSMD